MDTVFRARRNTTDERSGGKIMRGRRAAVVRSPYARPTSSPRQTDEQEEGNPNWLLGFVAPATRMITGAGKFISNAFFPDSPSNSSSSSEDDGSDDEDSSTEGAGRSDQAARPEPNKCSQNEVQLRMQKSEAKLVIEQLLMQETFSRDECNRLVNIIRSRTLEFPAMKEGDNSRQHEFTGINIGSNITLPGALSSDLLTRNSPARSYLGTSFDSLSPRAALGGYTPDFRNTAVLEAKKWLEEKKLESYSQLDKSEGTFTSNTSMLPNVTDGDEGSPVLVAKSYMKSRPPWASPTLSHMGFQASPNHLFKEETLFSSGAHPLLPSKVTKRASDAVDASNTQDGTRRVRFKSVEASSEQIDSSILELENRGSKNLAEAEIRSVEEGAVTLNSNSSPMVGSVDVSTPLLENLAVYDGPRTQAFPSSSATLSSDRIQDLEDLQVLKGGHSIVNHELLDPNSSLQKQNGPANESADIVFSEANINPSEDIRPALGSDSNDGVNDAHESSLQPKEEHVNNSSQPHQSSDLKDTNSTDDPSSMQENHSKEKEVNKSRDPTSANGLPLPSSLFVELNAESSPRRGKEGNTNPISSTDSKMATGIPLEKSCELLSEVSVEVPTNDDTESINSGSQSDELWQPKREIVSSKRRSTVRIEKQVAKKVGKYSRRGRGRGK